MVASTVRDIGSLIDSNISRHYSDLLSKCPHGRNRENTIYAAIICIVLNCGHVSRSLNLLKISGIFGLLPNIGFQPGLLRNWRTCCKVCCGATPGIGWNLTISSTTFSFAKLYRPCRLLRQPQRQLQFQLGVRRRYQFLRRWRKLHLFKCNSSKTTTLRHLKKQMILSWCPVLHNKGL